MHVISYPYDRHLSRRCSHPILTFLTFSMNNLDDIGNVVVYDYMLCVICSNKTAT